MGEPTKDKNYTEKTQEIADKTSQILRLLEQLGRSHSNNLNSAESTKTTPAPHKFWGTQPLLKEMVDPKDIKDGPIEENKEPSSIRSEPYPLPNEFKWCEVDIDDEVERDELYSLLNLNYVEDVESMFRFDYPPKFLEWALKAPEWRKDWHVGVRVADSGKLVAFISAIPTSLSIRAWDVNAVEVNFLCIHKKLRSKRLAPVLIREITRRVNLSGIFQALFTAGTVLPGVISKAKYYHRPLNYKKLVEVGFTGVPLGKTIDQMVMRYHLSKDHSLGPNFRAMREPDVPAVAKLLSEYLGKYSVKPNFSEDEVRHWLLPRPGIMNSFVLESSDGTITDFVSFYALPSTAVGNPLHQNVKVAYLYYYASQSTSKLSKLIHASLIMAKEMGFDVFNAVEIMENGTFFSGLKFGEGDGSLHYYLYNWQTRPIEGSELAVVML